MAPRMVIADSDDEDGEISPIHSPDKPVTPAIAQLSRSSDPSRATGSTDMAFFQAVYNEQQEAAFENLSHIPAGSFAVIAGGSSSLSAREILRGKTNTANTSSLSFITDPSASSRRLDKAKLKDVDDLTQVTTPGRGIQCHGTDLWDVPSSPASGSARKTTRIAKAKTSKTISKGKGEKGMQDLQPIVIVMPSPQLAGEPMDDEDGSLLPTSKKRKRGSKLLFSQTEEDVDMVLVPHSTETYQHAAVESQQDTAPPSMVHETMFTDGGSVSLRIEPPVMSAKQRLQYQSINLSSDGEAPHLSLEIPSNQATVGHKSSGATTIAYTTPSQHRSSGPMLPQFEHTPVGKSDSRTRKRKFTMLVEPSSSPDVITTSDARRKRTRPSNDSDDEVPDIESWESEDAGFGRETHIPRISRQRSSAANRHIGIGGLANEPVLETHTNMGELDTTSPSASDILEVLPEPKKRGRKKKINAAEMVPAEGVAVDIARKPLLPQVAAISEVQDVTQSTQPKRKRGRPKKSDKAATITPEQVLEKNSAPIVGDSGNSKMKDIPETQVVSHASTKAPSKASSVKAKKPDKAKQNEPHAENIPAQADAQELKVSRALQETSVNQIVAQRSAKADIVPLGGGLERNSLHTGSDKKELSKHEALGSKGKPAIAASQAGKQAVYRVGLSKRSRIAPLLKCLRK